MKIAFFGTPEFAVPSLSAILDSGHEVTLVVAQPDRPAGRGMKIQAPAVARKATSEGLRLLQPAKIRDVDFLEAVRRAEPELAVVVAYGRILPDQLLEIPTKGFINVHASLLPHYRGAAPIQRAIETGETLTGVSIMQVDSELDHGPVFATSSIEIGPDELAPELAMRLSATGGTLLARVMSEIAEGTAQAVEQDHRLATLAPKLEKREGLLDWEWSARKAYDRFRAFYPWPGITLRTSDGEPLKITGMRRLDEEGTPSSILRIAPDGVAVAMSRGALLLREIQRPGKQPSPAFDYVLGKRLRVGEPFS